MTFIFSAVFGSKATAPSVSKKVHAVEAEVGTETKALHELVRIGDIEELKEQLSSGSMDPNELDHRGDAPLHLAIKIGRTEAVEALLACPTVNPNLLNKDGNAPIHIAASWLERESARALLTHKETQVDLFNAEGDAAIHVLAKTRRGMLFDKHDQRRDLLWELVEMGGCHPELRNSSGLAAIHISAFEADHRFVEQLLSFDDADPMLTTTPIASFSRDLGLRKEETGLDRLLKGHPSEDAFKTLEVFKKYGADLHRSYSGTTPLSLAASYASGEQIHDYISADVLEASELSPTDLPLHHALFNEDIIAFAELVNALVDAGYSLDKTDEKGNTALHKAVELGQVAQIPLLLQKEASPTVQNHRGDTPLKVAAKKCDPLTIECLLHYDAVRASADRLDMLKTVAMWARPSVAPEEELYPLFIPPHMSEAESHAMLTFAVKCQRPQLIQHLLNFGAKAHARVEGAEYTTALDCAKALGCKDCERILIQAHKKISSHWIATGDLNLEALRKLKEL